MKRSGIGVGSASIVLVFAVLCLTVFSLITLVVAGNDRTLVDTEVQLVMGYYEADALAEHIVAEIVQADTIPDSVRGIDIMADFDHESGAEIAYFFCPISNQKELYVRLALNGNSCDILSWRMWDTGDWVVDDNLEVWQGPDEFGSIDPSDVWLGLDPWDAEVS